MKSRNIIFLTVAAVLFVIATATASTYFTREALKKEDAQTEQTSKAAAQKINWDNARTTRTQSRSTDIQTAAVACDDGNIAGKVIGGVGGGVLASNVGKGKGKTAATIGGTLGGAYLGGQYIPTRNATCN